jgi:transposase
MVSKRKRFTREFKIETLYRWVQKYDQNPKDAFPGKGHQASEADENRRLKRENQRLRMERDILKKAMAIFSNDPK